MTPEELKNLYDIENTEDLPFRIDLERKKLMSKIETLINEAPHPLTCNHLRAALYRKHKEEHKRQTVASRVSCLVHTGRIKRVKRGLYHKLDGS